jgi:hypothetical protein
MSDFVFTSPGVQFKEKELDFVTRQIGTTFLGLVGETEKGPAFEPIKIEDRTQFRRRLGNQSVKRFPNGELQYQLPYVANAFLEESSELYVTRVLGLSGYESGDAWAITIDGGYGPDEDAWVEVSAETVNSGGSISVTGTTYTINSDVTISVTEDVADQKIDGINIVKNGTNFERWKYEYTITNHRSTNNTFDISWDGVMWEAPQLEEYNDMVVCVLRSRADITDVFNSNSTTDFLVVTEVSGSTSNGDLYGDFTIKVDDDTYKVSLNPKAPNFISRVFGVDGKDKDTKVWVEFVYPDLMKKLDDDNYGYQIKDIVHIDSETYPFFNDYTLTKYKTPETPWVVSQVMGDEVERLFKFISISDGKSANKEIKISFSSINIITGLFNVVIRDFNDTDDNPLVLESFVGCSMDKNSPSYIATKIGTSDSEYSLRSNLVMLEMNKEAMNNSVPCGFEGYYLNKYDESLNAITPKMFFKTKYEQLENPRNIYLGISETAYGSNGINQNFFNYNGWYNGIDVDILEENFNKTKGFHLDVAVNEWEDSPFVGGIQTFQTDVDQLNPESVYNDERARKFTFVPAGGFDGWNIHREFRTNGDNFKQGGIYDGVEEGITPMNDYQAWQTAINTFANPLNIYINLFATPGINWKDNTELVKEVIDMIERERADSLYVIDSPDENIPQIIGINKNDVLVSKDISNYLDTANIDSNYSCTYFPWVQMRDTQNGVNVFIPPTGEVVAAMAFTDKVKFPWFAPAGLQRGVTNAKKSKYRLSADARRILYSNRINPVADFANTGTAIFGQKTLQAKESALDRINVRRLLLQIKQLISNIAIRLVFEQNDQTTIDDFLSKATPVLSTIQRERGLEDFKIKMDDSINTPETRDRNELYGEIFLKPTKSVEYVGITFNITPAGASFEDV